MNDETPAGYMRDAQGRLVPESMVKPIDKLRDDVVLGIVTKAKILSNALGEFKRVTFSDVATFVTTSAEQYEVVLGGTKGNVTLRSFDGRYKVERQVQETIQFGEQLAAAKALIDECITGWTAGSSDEIRVLIHDAFQVDKAGNVNTNRVLSLRRLEIRDPRWQRAMQAIADAVTVTGSRSYVRVYERVGDTDKYVPIVLDLAGV